MASCSEKLRELVKQRLALDLSRREDAWLEAMLEELARVQGATSAACLESLQEEALGSPGWLFLIDRLTIAETYFFRDPGQMELLRERLLPRLMREAQGRRLRIWSAGCSTGEELYSVAMLLDGLGNPPADLLGTDIHPGVIEQARRGIYRERALRGLPVELRKVYLQPHGRDFRIHDRLRKRTIFSVESLFEEQSTQLRGLDLIICRNVLIYFERERLAAVLERFLKALRPGGLLLTGHGEILSVPTRFETLAYPQSLVYRRPDVLGRGWSTPTLSSAQAGTLSGGTSELLLDSSQESLAGEELDPRALCAKAREARRQGREATAQRWLWRALYLDPNLAEGYLELGLLLAGQDPEKARKHRATALELLGDGAREDAFEATLIELERRLS